MSPRWIWLVSALAALELAHAQPANPSPAQREAVRRYDEFAEVVRKTADMVSDREAVALAQRHGLSVVNVTWEDTGRYKGSSVGPNISDVTIQVEELHPITERVRVTCMPVIRYDNFSDRSADIAPRKFYILVGNERDGRELTRVTLLEYLDHLRDYLTVPASWKGDRSSLVCARDHKVLVSAQACFLPVPKGGSVEFNPAIFNYQSRQGEPAVLCILATRQGTSATIVDNTRDAYPSAGGTGQRLFYNQAGKKALLKGERKSDVATREADAAAGAGSGPVVKVTDGEGVNMVLLIQVPLKQRERERPEAAEGGDFATMAAPQAAAKDMERRQSDVEDAVISAGRVSGTYEEIDGRSIERDPRFPVRVTVQFYKATSNGVVAPEDVAEIQRSIERVYSHGSAVGSLVTDGFTGRITEYDGSGFQPPGWWASFWSHHERSTGVAMKDTTERLAGLYGEDWTRMAGSAALLSDAIEAAGGKPLPHSVALSLDPAGARRTASSASVAEDPAERLGWGLAGAAALLTGVLLGLRMRRRTA